MFESREEIRQIYLHVWGKMQRGEILEPMESLIADIIAAHPEYHEVFDGGDTLLNAEYTPEQGVSNPFLHLGMHIALREQAATDRPPGIRAIYRRLVGARGQLEAEHAMMECLGEALWSAQRNGREPDETAYLECLKKL